MGEFSIFHWLVVLAVILIFFGGKRIPEIMKGFGKAFAASKMAWRAHRRHRRHRQLRRRRSLPKKRSNPRTDDSAELVWAARAVALFISTRKTSEPALISSMLGDDQRDVVVLFLRAELLNLGNNRVHQALRRKPAIPPQRINQAPFAEFLILRVVRFRDAVSV